MFVTAVICVELAFPSPEDVRVATPGCMVPIRPVGAPRGRILDRSGRVLAIDVPSATVYADARKVRDVPRTAVRLAGVVGVEADAVRTKLRRMARYPTIARDLDAEVGDRVSKLLKDLPGIALRRGKKRVYPQSTLASQVLGFTAYNGQGLVGVEKAFDKELRPRGRERDADENIAGNHVYLTIDSEIQMVAERALAKMASRYHPQSAYAIVMNPSTGEILAMADYPEFDSNKRPRSLGLGRWCSGAVADLYEPGRPLSIITMAASLEEGVSSCGVVVDRGGQGSGYDVAGLAGSAQTPAYVKGTPDKPGGFCYSFIGFAPAQAPRVTIAVVVRLPSNSRSSATVATRLFREIREAALAHTRANDDLQGRSNLSESR